MEVDAARPRGVIKAGPGPETAPTPPNEASAADSCTCPGASVPGAEDVVEAFPAVLPVAPGTVLGVFSTRGSSPTASSTCSTVGGSVGGCG